MAIGDPTVSAPAARQPPTRLASPLEALTEAATALSDGLPVGAVLAVIADAAAASTRADLALVRVVEGDSPFATARAVATASRSLAAELEGARTSVSELAADELDETTELPLAVARLRARVGADGVLVVPVVAAGRLVGSLELFGRARAFGSQERLVARLAAAQAAVAVRTLGSEVARDGVESKLELAGAALTAAADERGAALDIARVAAQATSARVSVLWKVADDATLERLAGHGDVDADILRELRSLATHALAGHDAVAVGNAAGDAVATVVLGWPARWLLQVVLAGEETPSAAVCSALAGFAGRAAHALDTSFEMRTAAAELERTRTLLAVVAQANAELSLAHTLETVVDRVGDLLAIDRVAVYLRDEEEHLLPAAARGLEGPHTPVAERLLELALGPVRGRGMVLVSDARRDARLAAVRAEVAAASIDAAVGAPLLVPEGVTGLLAVYPPAGRTLNDDEWALLAALAAQLAVAVQNASLHERATALGAELEEVLSLERQAARQLGALYEISRSFAQTLSLETTLHAVARTVVDLLSVDAVAIHMPDPRGEHLEPRAVHVGEARLAPPIRALLERSIPLDRLPRRSVGSQRAVALDAETARAVGSGFELLVPFLEKGSTAAFVPIATPAELLGTLTVLALDPERPITADMSDLALSVAAQAALAIDNARLYQQQKEFADTMQRSLLPRSNPELEGLELGAVYESSARVEVGGDVYDFLVLPDGRLAVVLGDVTGHGVDAAADMAMAKFVFRSLARDRSEPHAFLAAANDIVCGEIGAGKFITMAYLTVDGRDGALSAAAAGHPRPRVVHPDGTVEQLAVGGLALGIVPEQDYDELRRELPPGAAVVVFTDGVVEARRDGELFGDERLDRLLARQAGASANDVAGAVLAACRTWSDGELEDDLAVVVIKRRSS